MWFVLLFLVSENHEAFWEAARTGDLAVIKQLTLFPYTTLFRSYTLSLQTSSDL